MPRGGHAERAMQGSWRQEYGAADAGGRRAQQAGKVETRALFAGSQGGTVAPAGGNTCAPRSARLDLRGPAVQRSDTDCTYLAGQAGIDATYIARTPEGPIGTGPQAV